jgi:hypothetical protein
VRAERPRPVVDAGVGCGAEEVIKEEREGIGSAFVLTAPREPSEDAILLRLIVVDLDVALIAVCEVVRDVDLTKD